MDVVAGICDRMVVLSYGELIAEGAPRAVLKDEKVVSAYLGTSRRDAA
jgi:branched-chain amino acid transport system ATP-binding protein